MTISNVWTRSKAMVAKVFTVGLLAGAVVMAAPSRADAQVSFGVRFGGPAYGPVYRRPVYVAPAYVAPAYGYYGPGYYNRFGWDRRAAFSNHERFDHYHHLEGWGR